MRLLDALADPAEARAAAALALGEGQVVAIPTDTVYGLAVPAGDETGTARLAAIKQRPVEKHIAVLVAGKSQALELAAPPKPPLERVMDRCWPGAVTVVLDAAEGTVGVRCPDDPWLRELLAATGPLATTSANRHDEPPIQNANEILEAFGDQLALVVDGGPRSGQASTVIAMPESELEILREGALDAATIWDAAGLARPTS